ncbi:MULTISPECIES: DUF4825 domain-containing protein [Brevibacillus]|uniref:DUF4825 domain-containing protein n=1 Tax=Brevibacillus TaxID=55080 RepID=UPI0002A4D640|nr:MULTISPECIES: DUF4825 domain-containing protein [Brevibacillus]ELK40453.1 hypothetical protein D478_19109 [Brevibacillus agri BAB-2500]MBG9568046.1 hypothetical protein [Brevibacillus agri]MDN4095978.1 DUF4825 domain-containing protein [Brevibacillus agri]MED3500093.1 DUF4825 domain-containing protein [Brevibacillus agri]QHZ55047.1 DUF4825 domain-containing protein [Brevibacillus sp. NSP2.1]
MKNKLILLLALLGIGLFAVIQGWILPKKELAAEQYLADQQSPLTHDLQTILPYKNKYMGDVSNLNLFNHLPLKDLKRSYQLRSDEFAIEVHYEADELREDEKAIRQMLLYNSVAAFALIDNLQTIDYRFLDRTLTVSRSRIQQLFGDDLAALLTTEKWRANVQQKWQDARFLQEGVKALEEKQ